MSMLGERLEGADVLDLFAGSGALGLESLSRGARHVTFVESSRAVARSLEENIEALDAGSLSDVVIADVFDYVERLASGAVDIALADPPYGQGLAARLLQRFRQLPFAQILSLEHGSAEPLEVPPPGRVRRYGDTAIAIITLEDSQEE